MTRSRPNILLIVSDDHGYADRSALGSSDARTPALDRLAAEGTTYTDAYVTAPICSPSRAGLITGRYQQRWGATWFDTSELGPETTVAERLGSAGYATGYFGKVHYGSEGPGDRGTPPEHGFDESFYGLAGQSMGRLHYLHHTRAAVTEYGESAEAMAVQPFWSGRHEVEFDGFTTAEIADRALDFIERPREAPFFTMVAFNAVHNFCWQLPEAEREARGLPELADWYPGADEYLDWYDGAISPRLPDGRAYYLAQLELMDQQIGRMLDRLDTLGIADDTLVVYLTDNGGSRCNFGDNGELRGTKYTLWEGGVRVPFLVRWPGSTDRGRTEPALVSSLDLAATFSAVAGLDADHELDGRDLRRAASTAERELHWDCDWQWAVRRGRWKLSCFDAGSSIAGYVRQVEHSEPGDGLMLCDLEEDPGEHVDLAARHPEVVAELVERHRAWRQEVGLAGPSSVAYE